MPCCFFRVDFFFTLLHDADSRRRRHAAGVATSSAQYAVCAMLMHVVIDAAAAALYAMLLMPLRCCRYDAADAMLATKIFHMRADSYAADTVTALMRAKIRRRFSPLARRLFDAAAFIFAMPLLPLRHAAMLPLPLMFTRWRRFTFVCR